MNFRWSRARVLLVAVALIVVTNAVVLAGVAYNRSGEPEAVIRLTERGRAEFRTIDARSSEATAAMLAGVPAADRRRLVAAMATIEGTLAPRPGEPPRAYLLREPGPGDLGWMVQRNGAVYAAQYGWDQSYEALVARIVADFAQHHQPGRERAWIAEMDGEPVGCVLCVRRDDETAQLRILLVDPAARGRSASC